MADVAFSKFTSLFSIKKKILNILIIQRNLFLKIYKYFLGHF